MKFSILWKVILFLLVSVFANGQEVPGVIQFNASDYDGDHQNWKITQDCEGKVFVANSDGILSFNGMKWDRISLPGNRKVRAVFTGVDCKVYAGGFKTFGYLDFQDGSSPTYVDITDSLLEGNNQEIWNIFGNEDYIVFQSFSNIYLYDYHKVHSIIPPTNIMFGNNINNELYVPGITQGFYKMKGPDMEFVKPSSSLPEDSKIAALCPSISGQGVIAATQQHGLYFLSNNQVTPITARVNEILKIEQINRMIKLDSDRYVVGTILNGIYILDSTFQIVHNINKTNGLTNNTVLSLYEDRNGDVWVGLDKGINLIKTSDPIMYYFDIEGQLGTFFCYKYYEKDLFIGTNQGVFKKHQNGTFGLIPGLQGQAWSFFDTGNGLLCAHNNGIYELKSNETKEVDVSTGAWWLERINKDTILVSTYTGLSRLTKSTIQGWETQRLEGGEFQLDKFVIDDDNSLIGYNPQNQIYVMRFNEDFSEIIHYKSYYSLENQQVNSNISLFNLGSRIVVGLEDQYFVYDNGAFQIVSLTAFEKDIKSQLINMPGYHAFQLTKSIGDRMPRITSVNPSDQNYLISYDKGYAIVPVKYHFENYRNDSIYIDKVLVNGKEGIVSLTENTEYDYSENNLVIQLGNKNFYEYFPDRYAYKLEGWSELWYPLPQDGQLEFINLTNRDYSLLLRSNESENTQRLWEFSIQPIWYKSWQGFLLYLLIISIFIWLINRRHEFNLKQERRKLEEEKRKELERERVNSKNEKLERELVHKSKMLANSALTLAQKNKMLSELKSIIKKIDKHETRVGKVKQKLLHLIDVNINSDDEWEIFEKNFEEVHETFLNTLKNNYPEITAGELRLAAYIKMNLSSKEIAPLLNISVRSVENKRYRLRKKMDLSPEEPLSEHLMRL